MVSKICHSQTRHHTLCSSRGACTASELHNVSSSFLLHCLHQMTFAKGTSVRQVGVGNSQLQLDMVLDGYISILSIDYADVVIAQLQQAHIDYPQLQYAVADARYRLAP